MVKPAGKLAFLSEIGYYWTVKIEECNQIDSKKGNADYELINTQLHRLYDGVLAEPIPKRLISTVKKHKTKRNKRGSILLIILIGMILGGVIGVFLHQSQQLEFITNTKLLLEKMISRII